MKKFFIPTILFIITYSVYPQQQFFDAGTYTTVSGDTIFNCVLGYRTFGNINSDSSNVIIYPTWFGGESANLKDLIGQDKLVDSTKYFVIAIDALSNGISSSPSNYTGARAFPHINIRDMVNTQYLMLTRHFKFKNIHGIIGGSMGGMQVFEWIAAYPGYITKAVAYVSTPKPTSYDLLQWNIRKEIIESYRRLGAPDKQIHKILRMESSLHARTPDYLAYEINEDEFDKYMTKFDSEPDSIFTIDNYKSQLEAMLDHDIYRLNSITFDNLKDHITAEVMIISAETDHLVHDKNTRIFAQTTGSEIIFLNNNRGHLAVGYELDYCGKLTREFFD
ncbi:MAG: alpha/beta fold hydrolase [Melioribacteraceae bacterium]|nr:alpha/beta fold hydrolase [Melioribacteraceae bacterium]